MLNNFYSSESLFLGNKDSTRFYNTNEKTVKNISIDDHNLLPNKDRDLLKKLSWFTNNKLYGDHLIIPPKINSNNKILYSASIQLIEYDNYINKLTHKSFNLLSLYMTNDIINFISMINKDLSFPQFIKGYNEVQRKNLTIFPYEYLFSLIIIFTEFFNPSLLFLNYSAKSLIRLKYSYSHDYGINILNDMVFKELMDSLYLNENIIVNQINPSIINLLMDIQLFNLTYKRRVFYCQQEQNQKFIQWQNLQNLQKFIENLQDSSSINNNSTNNNRSLIIPSDRCILDNIKTINNFIENLPIEKNIKIFVNNGFSKESNHLNDEQQSQLWLEQISQQDYSELINDKPLDKKNVWILLIDTINELNIYIKKNITITINFIIIIIIIKILFYIN